MVDKVILESPLNANQQAFMNQEMGLARIKEREKAAAEGEAAQLKAREDSDKAALVAESKWQELAGTYEARVKELEPFEAQAKAYGELVAGQLKAKIEALGDGAKTAVAALPEAMTALEKLNWLTKNEGLFAAVSGGIGTPGSRKTPLKKKSAADVGHRRLRI